MAARAVEEELAAGGLPVVHQDAYQYVSPLSRWAYTQLHLGLTEFSPRVYGPLYRFANQSRLLAEAYRQFSVFSRAVFARTVAQLRPHLIVTTHAIGCALAAPLKDRFGFRLVTLTTDYYAHAFQYHPKVDRYCASHAWTAADLRAAGVSPDRVVVTGIPLRRSFDTFPNFLEARQQLGLPLDRPFILITRGGMAVGRETVSLLEALLTSPLLGTAVFVAVLGSRERGYQLVSQRFGGSSRVRLLRFVENMEVFLAAADVVIGKAGGLSSTEVFTAGRPLVVYAPNVGIETPNVQRWMTAGAVIDAARSPATAVRAVREILTEPRRREALVAGGRALVTPRSRQAVRGVLEQLLAEPVPARAFR